MIDTDAFFDEIVKIGGAKRYGRILASWGRKKAKGEVVEPGLEYAAEDARDKLVRSMVKRKQAPTLSKFERLKIKLTKSYKPATAEKINRREAAGRRVMEHASPKTKAGIRKFQEASRGPT